MTVKLTERDRKLVFKCALCRWLTTTQLKRLYFPNATLNAVQKRLRKLADAGYLRAYREHPTAEVVHSLGPKGKPLVEEAGAHAMVAGEVPKQIEHLLGVNEVRFALETGGIGIRYFFAHWQLSDLGWAHPVIPDAVFAFDQVEHGTLVLEFDRGTESLDALLRKLEFYERGLGDLTIGATVIVTETDRRIDLLGSAINLRAFRLKVFAAPVAEVSRDVLGPIFVNVATGNRERLIEPVPLP